MTLQCMNLRFTISLHQVGEAFTRDGDHLDWFFQIDADPGSPVACFSTSVDVDLRVRDSSTILVCAALLPDHRAAYLDYDGKVSGNRGSVTRLVTGLFEWVSTGQSESRVRLHLVETIVSKPSTRMDGSMLQLVDRLRETSIILLESS